MSVVLLFRHYILESAALCTQIPKPQHLKSNYTTAQIRQRVTAALHLLVVYCYHVYIFTICIKDVTHIDLDLGN